MTYRRPNSERSAYNGRALSASLRRVALPVLGVALWVELAAIDYALNGAQRSFAGLMYLTCKAIAAAVLAHAGAL